MVTCEESDTYNTVPHVENHENCNSHMNITDIVAVQSFDNISEK